LQKGFLDVTTLRLGQGSQIATTLSTWYSAPKRVRVIVDYSFHGVSVDTVKLSPAEAMQFRKANKHLQAYLVKVDPKDGDCHMYMVDILDGFYRVPLSTSGVLKLGLCLSKLLRLPELVAFPLVLPMGWT
jgi:hypothetical protein